MKTLIFDCGGVLAFPRMGDWNLPLGAKAILGDRAREIHTAKYLSAHRQSMEWLDESRLVPDTEAERQLKCAYFREISRLMGWPLSPVQIGALGDDFTDNLDRYAFFAGVNDWLDRWKRDYRIGMLSDAMPSMVQALKRQGLYALFDAVVISTEVGAIKPDPRMYAAALDALDARAEDCLFIDDRPCNVEGALAAGMRAVRMIQPSFPPAGDWNGPAVLGFEGLDALLADGSIWRQEPAP